MIKKCSKKSKGFSIIELVISIAIFCIILLAIVSSIIWMYNSKSRIEADNLSLDNARKALDAMVYEIKMAKGIYTPTTTSSQLSLETSDYLPAGESNTYIDFFLCGTSVCLKTELQQNPVYLTSSDVNVTNLAFTQISTNNKPSVQINLTISNVNLTSTAALRSY